MSAAASGLHICTAWHFKLCMCHGMVCTLYIIIYACSCILYNHLLQAAIHQHDTYTISGATICDLHNTGCVLYVLQATAAVQTNAELLAAAQKLAQLSQEKAEQAAIDQQTDLVSELSQAAGTNVVLQEINDGTFKGYTLSVSVTNTAAH